MLENILKSARERLPAIVAEEPALRRAAATAPAVRDFGVALDRSGLQIIAEIKRRSPSAGEISPGLDAAARARLYEEGGAAAISVLTEPEFFGGSLDDLRLVRSAVGIPVLRKDFVLHPAQIWEARAAGADAVLLIVAALGDEELAAMLETAKHIGLAALVEAHTAAEADRAIAAGARIVGINNRDLHTFVTDLSVAESMAPHLEAAAITVAESGVSSETGALRMSRAGYDAILVGEAAVRSSEPVGFIKSLRGSAP